MISEELASDSLVLRALANSGLGRIQQLSMLLEMSPMSNRHEVASPANLIDGTTHCDCTVQHDRLCALLGLFPSTLRSFLTVRPV